MQILAQAHFIPAAQNMHYDNWIIYNFLRWRGNCACLRRHTNLFLQCAICNKNVRFQTLLCDFVQLFIFYHIFFFVYLFLLLFLCVFCTALQYASAHTQHYRCNNRSLIHTRMRSYTVAFAFTLCRRVQRTRTRLPSARTPSALRAPAHWRNVRRHTVALPAALLHRKNTAS